MKSILVIGLGRFGYHLAVKMQELGNEVVVVEKDPERAELYSDELPDVQIGDCTNESVLRSLGVNNFDICFVTAGEDFSSSLEITATLKDLGARYVVAKANSERQERFLKRLGADEVVCPEREISEKTAIRFNANKIYDCVTLTSEYSIFEIAVPEKWFGETICKINVRRKYKINIIAIKRNNKLNTTPDADYCFEKGDHMIVIGTSGSVFKLTSGMK